MGGDYIGVCPEGSLQESVIFHCVGPGDRTQVIRLGGKSLYLLCHLSDQVKDLKGRSLSWIIWLNLDSITCHFV